VPLHRTSNADDAVIANGAARLGIECRVEEVYAVRPQFDREISVIKQDRDPVILRQGRSGLAIVETRSASLPAMRRQAMSAALMAFPSRSAKALTATPPETSSGGVVR
jgi:hypothetical protein